jgi:urease accessory protein UreH
MDPETHAEQRVSLRAEANASCEYYPCLTIPYPGSALRQTIDVDSAPGARVGIVECWAMGRTARTEYLAFRSLASRTTIVRQGRPTYVDAMRLEPQSVDVGGAGILAGRRYLVSGVWTGVAGPLEEEPAAPLTEGSPLIAFGTSSPGLGYLRVLGTDGPCVDRVIRASVERVSRSWGLAPVSLSRFHN